jgi:hypothetical protein
MRQGIITGEAAKLITSPAKKALTKKK